MILWTKGASSTRTALWHP
ncbi:MAG TPA: hypothetical protein DCY59_13285 [Micrococcaceae bacterium]|nr:hypothetical protein [Micrococcaceae bacterium]